jgi:hypothetical protein
MNEILIVTGGVLCAVGVVFHGLFWRMLDWKSDLRSLSVANRSLMPVMNLCLMFVFLLFAVLSLAHTDELLSTPMGHSILALIGLFWLFRAALQVIFWRLKTARSWALMSVSLILAALYGVPALAVL